jgi:hypothetical protein
MRLQHYGRNEELLVNGESSNSLNERKDALGNVCGRIPNYGPTLIEKHVKKRTRPPHGILPCVIFFVSFCFLLDYHCLNYTSRY